MKMTDVEIREWEAVRENRVIDTKSHTIKQNDPLAVSAFSKTDSNDNFGISFGSYAKASKFFQRLRTAKNPVAYLRKVSESEKGYIE